MSDLLLLAACLVAALGFGVERFVSQRTSTSDPLIRPTRQGLRAGAGFFAAAIALTVAAWLLAR